MNIERLRDSAERISGHFGGQSVTLSRPGVGLFETVSGDAATLTCGTASATDTILPLASAQSLSGRVSAGVSLAIAGHSGAYVIQGNATPSGASLTVTISPGLEFDVNGEAVTLTARQLTFYGGQINLNAYSVPAGWTVGAKDEVWSLVPSNTDDGQEPRDGDRMTSPIAGKIRKVGGRERVEYVVLVTPNESAEAV